jgi:hypothetical protein
MSAVTTLARRAYRFVHGEHARPSSPVPAPEET